MSNNLIRHLTFVAFAIAFIYYAGDIFGSYKMFVVENIAIYAILALSYNLINGVTGQFSLEPNGFVAIGAYFTAILLLPTDAKTDMFALVDPAPIILQMHTSSLLIALLVAGLASTIIALFLSFPVFRVRGDYLAIVTLGFGFIIRIFAINNPQYTNGAMGLNDISSGINFYWIGGILLVTFIVMLNIIYSKYGRAMKSVRDDEDAATAMGINTFKIKTLAFMTSAFFEGIGGGLLATLITTITPDQFSFLLTFNLLIIVVLGGLGSMSGTLIATILVMVSMEALRFLDDMKIGGETHPGLRMVVFSIILILVMLFARKGLLGDRELLDFFKKSKK